jgi:16S rRNA processing protein RimM
VGRPHGLDGSFYVTRPRTALLADGGVLRVGDTETTIVRLAGTAEKPIVKVACAGSREAVVALRGQDLTVAREGAPPLDEDEWYADDLKGCAVCDEVAGVEVGVVRELMPLPSCEALVVDRADDKPELLVPLVSDCVRSVDIAARRIDIDLAFLGETP